MEWNGNGLKASVYLHDQMGKRAARIYPSPILDMMLSFYLVNHNTTTKSFCVYR